MMVFGFVDVSLNMDFIGIRNAFSEDIWLSAAHFERRVFDFFFDLSHFIVLSFFICNFILQGGVIQAVCHFYKARG